MIAQHRTDRRGDVGRGERSRGHLVEHRLEEVVVGAVHHGDLHRGPPEFPGEVEPGEAATHDHDTGAHKCMVSRRQRANPMTSRTGGMADSLP
jgi:hypothetical protein